MTGALIEIFQQGTNDLISGEGYVSAGVTAYRWGGVVLGQVRKFWGRQQEENIEAISKMAQKKLKDIPEDRKTPPSASVAEPLIEAAMQESRPEIQELWAGLLASAMLDGGKNARYEFKDILAKISPQDAVLLRILWGMPQRRWPGASDGNNRDYIDKELQRAGFNDYVFEASIGRLYELRCAVPSTWAASVAEERQRLRYPEVSALGWLLLEAINPR